MSTSGILIFDSLLLCLLLCFSVSNSQDRPTVFDCSNDTSYYTNSTSGRIYRSNLDVLLSTLTSNASRPDGFYNFTVGSVDPANYTAIFGLFLCRGDVAPNDCQDCLATARTGILQNCPNMKSAGIWYDTCMLRYSNQSIFSRRDSRFVQVLYNINNVSEPALFNKLLGDTMNEIATKAANSDKKFAAKEANFSTFQRRLYALVQCTPDISSLDCGNCLSTAIAYLPDCCNNSLGGTIISFSCDIRYETYPFFNEISTPPPVPTPNLLPPPPPLLSPPTGKGKPESFL